MGVEDGGKRPVSIREQRLSVQADAVIFQTESLCSAACLFGTGRLGKTLHSGRRRRLPQFRVWDGKQSACVTQGERDTNASAGEIPFPSAATLMTTPAYRLRFPHEYDILRGSAGFQARGIGGQATLQRGRPQIFRCKAVVESHAVIAVVGCDILADCPPLPHGSNNKSAAVNVENRSLLIANSADSPPNSPSRTVTPLGGLGGFRSLRFRSAA